MKEEGMLFGDTLLFRNIAQLLVARNWFISAQKCTKHIREMY